jgi:hypothetical protein
MTNIVLTERDICTKRIVPALETGLNAQLEEALTR